MSEVLEKIKILYSDHSVLAIDKPFGLVVHSDGRTDEPALTDWVASRYPETKNVGEPIQLKNGSTIERPGIVHRLDRDTSGVMLIALTAEAHEYLKQQFKDRTVSKEYRAFVYGHLPEDSGTIDRPIGRHSSNFKLYSAQRGARGSLRDAVTEYTTLEKGAENSYIALFPRTGRTHQLRVHMKAVHHPIVCDTLYAPKHDCILGFDRLALHSHKISFKTLVGEVVEVESPLPDMFLKALEETAF